MAAEEMADNGKEQTKAKPKADAPPSNGIEIDIKEPLAFWLLILIIGLAFEVILLPIANGYGVDPGITGLLSKIAGWILFLPGSIILPLIASVWIGERVGAKRNKVTAAVSVGGINAAYTALIYLIAIIIIYLLIYFITPNFLTTSNISLGYYVEYVVIIPIIIVILMIPFISALSAARHSSM